MTAAVGHPTLRLVRVAIGDLTLDDLAPGQWRPVMRDAIAKPPQTAANRPKKGQR